MNGKYGRKRPYYGLGIPDINVLESQVLKLDDFTDGTGATGYIDVATALPIGAIPIAWKIDILTGFATAEFTGTPTNLAFVDGSTGEDTITTDEADYSFVDDGFEVGNSIVVSGATTAGNDGTYVLTGVAAQTLTVESASFSMAEDGIADMTITGIATVSVGVSGDTDRFSADTAKSVAATGSVGSSALAADACDNIATAQTIRVTVTEGSDFGEFNTGAIKLYFYYIKTA